MKSNFEMAIHFQIPRLILKRKMRWEPQAYTTGQLVALKEKSHKHKNQSIVSTLFALFAGKKKPNKIIIQLVRK